MIKEEKISSTMISYQLTLRNIPTSINIHAAFGSQV